MLGQRRRRLANIKTALVQRLLLNVFIIICMPHGSLSYDNKLYTAFVGKIFSEEVRGNLILFFQKIFCLNRAKFPKHPYLTSTKVYFLRRSVNKYHNNFQT